MQLKQHEFVMAATAVEEQTDGRTQTIKEGGSGGGYESTEANTGAGPETIQEGGPEVAIKAKLVRLCGPQHIQNQIKQK